MSTVTTLFIERKHAQPHIQSQLTSLHTITDQTPVLWITCRVYRTPTSNWKYTWNCIFFVISEPDCQWKVRSQAPSDLQLFAWKVNSGILSCFTPGHLSVADMSWHPWGRARREVGWNAPSGRPRLCRWKTQMPWRWSRPCQSPGQPGTTLHSPE